MPSSTFFHLPEEKRAKLLRCAREEFARAAYPDASINRIIQAAGIPRGSFYMYFEDKGELFYYLLSEYGHRLVGHMEQALARHGGDLLPAFLDFFDAVVLDYRTTGGEEYEALGKTMRLNPGLRPGAFLREDMHALLRDLTAKIDRARLDLRRDGDLEAMLQVLVGVAGHYIKLGILSDDPERVRAEFTRTLDILARGMAMGPKAAVSHT